MFREFHVQDLRQYPENLRVADLSITRWTIYFTSTPLAAQASVQRRQGWLSKKESRAQHPPMGSLTRNQTIQGQ
jgi:hypothetical protein